MEQEQTPKQVQPEDTEIFQIEEQDAKREFNIPFHAHSAETAEEGV